MRKMDSYIEIGNYIFRTGKVNAISIKRSRKNIGNTATIRIPNFQKKLDGLLKVGDPVLIKFGYDGDLKEEFAGYVTGIKPKSPLEISCEDELWKLRQETVTKSWKSTNLQEVNNYLLPGAEIETQPIVMAPFRLDRVSKAEALAKIKNEFGIDVFHRLAKWYVGFAYNEKNTPHVKYHFQKNAWMDQLEYKKEEDIKLQVKAISILPNNKRIEVDLGDKEGDTRTLHFYNKTEAEIRSLASEKIKQMKHDGYVGKFKAKGLPFIDHSWIVELQDDFYTNRAGNYFVDEVITTYDENGINREIVLGKKAS